MIYRPTEPSSLWDSCLFEWQGTFHLYHLQSVHGLWDQIGHAVSDDLLHWTPRPAINVAGQPGQWNQGPMILTGMVVPHEGLFYLFAGGRRTGCQVMGVFTSDDLDTWHPHPNNPVLCSNSPHYLDAPTPLCPEVDWRDPCIAFRPDDGHYHALLCARGPRITHADSGAMIAHVRSTDLIHWEHLPPIETPTGCFYDTEVPDLFTLDGRYYLLFSTATSGGFQINTACRENVTGTFYMVSDSPDGPFTLPDDCLLAGAGEGRMTSYCGRTIAYQGGRLFYHHINRGGNVQAQGSEQGDRELPYHINLGGNVQTSRHTWASPKMVRARGDGNVYLEYMPLLEKLETRTLCDPTAVLPCFQPDLYGQWDRNDAAIVGECSARTSSCTVHENVSDFHLSCRIRSSGTARPGILLRAADGEAALVTLNFDRQRLEIGSCNNDRSGWGLAMADVLATNGTSYLYQDLCRRELRDDTEYLLRIFVRDEHFEVYLDDRWAFTTVITSAPKAGSVALAVARGQATFTDLRLAAIEPLA